MSANTIRLGRRDAEALRVAAAEAIRSRTLHSRPIPATLARAEQAITIALVADDGNKNEGAVHNWLTTTEAAETTGYSPRRLRQLAPQIGARKADHGWWLYPAEGLAQRVRNAT